MLSKSLSRIEITGPTAAGLRHKMNLYICLNNQQENRIMA